MKAFNVKWGCLNGSLDVDTEIFNIKSISHLSHLGNGTILNWVTRKICKFGPGVSFSSKPYTHRDSKFVATKEVLSRGTFVMYIKIQSPLWIILQ